MWTKWDEVRGIVGAWCDALDPGKIGEEAFWRNRSALFAALFAGENAEIAHSRAVAGMVDARAEVERRTDCHAGPGTTEPECGGCVSCLTRKLAAAEAEAERRREALEGVLAALENLAIIIESGERLPEEQRALELVRNDHRRRRIWVYGATPELALARARAEVESLAAGVENMKRVRAAFAASNAVGKPATEKP
jgi:hypothetical protein